jgi:hypothetical protein
MYALDFAEPDDKEEREAAAKRKWERYKNSRAGRLAASINSGDSRMVAEAPLAPHEVVQFRKFNLLKRRNK